LAENPQSRSPSGSAGAVNPMLKCQNFSVLSLLNREFEPETGSLETGSSATQSVSAAYVPNRDSNWRRSALFSKRTGPENNPQLKQFRDKLVAAGKPKLLALVAVARKLIITILNAILRDRRSWQQLPA